MGGTINVSRVVSRDPEIMSGTPVFSGTRVPVRILLEHLEAGETIDDFLDGFPTVTREQVIAFLAFQTNYKNPTLNSSSPRRRGPSQADDKTDIYLGPRFRGDDGWVGVPGDQMNGSGH